MNIFSTRSRIIVTCNKRLAPYLQQEITKLEFTIVRTFLTGVEIEGTVADCIRLNMNLRCASQVLYSLQEFTADGPEDVYQNLLRLPWETIFSPEGYFSVTSNVTHPSIRTSMFANVKVKDAVVDRMRLKTGVRPDSGSECNNTVIHLYWKDEQAEIFVDTSGQSLAKHGYRKIPGQAPMLEALASATLMATNWQRETPFINPMCGSGTLAIEAVLLATNRSPGLFRTNYGFMHLSGFDDRLYKKERQGLNEQITEIPGLTVIASDISNDAINISKVNAGIAGVSEYIHFETADFETTEVPGEGKGIVFLILSMANA